MKLLDRVLQRWRIRKAKGWIRPGDRVLDIGCLDGALLREIAPRISLGIGIDPLAVPVDEPSLRIIRGDFPRDIPYPPDSFDCITMLAVLEHVPDSVGLARDCADFLASGGRVVITVPHVLVDHILTVLHALRLIEGMSLEQHHGYDVTQTQNIFEKAGLRLKAKRSFQLGLNRLFVFEKA